MNHLLVTIYQRDTQETGGSIKGYLRTRFLATNYYYFFIKIHRKDTVHFYGPRLEIYVLAVCECALFVCFMYPCYFTLIHAALRRNKSIMMMISPPFAFFLLNYYYTTGLASHA